MIRHMMMAGAIVAFSAPAFADRTTSPQQAAATPDSTSLPQQQANGATTPGTLASNQVAVTPTPGTAAASNRNNDGSTTIDRRTSAFSGR